MAAGLGIVFLIAIRDDRFTSVTEVNSTLGDTVVGLLPEVSQEGGNIMPLLALNDPRHIYAESYRSLRSALLFLATEGERPKVLLIASAMPNEGKSTVAANLARTLSLSGSRVLLVDGDLRKGHLHHLLGLQSEPGLAELLYQTCEPDKVMQQDSLPNLTFIACGGRYTGNPGDLFLGSGLDQILARWRQEFDYVLIDSSPLFAADDASCLAPKVDGTLFVVRSRHSSARAAREALELLAQRQARVLGVIFNGADTSGRSYYYYKYADYYPSANTVMRHRFSRMDLARRRRHQRSADSFVRALRPSLKPPQKNLAKCITRTRRSALPVLGRHALRITANPGTKATEWNAVHAAAWQKGSLCRLKPAFLGAGAKLRGTGWEAGVRI